MTEDPTAIPQAAQQAEEQPEGVKTGKPYSQSNPLIIERIKKNNETGGLDVVLNLSLEQTYVLLQFAIMFLMSQGLAMFAPVAETQEKKEDTPEPTIVLDKQLH